MVIIMKKRLISAILILMMLVSIAIVPVSAAVVDPGGCIYAVKKGETLDEMWHKEGTCRDDVNQNNDAEE